MKSKNFQFLRTFFPNWKFFDDLGMVPVLSYKGDGQDSWRKVLPQRKFQWTDLIFNPWGNLDHSYHSLLSHLVSDIEEFSSTTKEDLESLVSFQLVKKLVLIKVRNYPEIQYFRFKLSLIDANSTKEEVCDFLISPLYEVKQCFS